MKITTTFKPVPFVTLILVSNKLLLFVTMLLFLFLLLGITTTTTTYVNNERYNDAGGLHFLLEGQLRFVVSTWNFVVQVDYDSLAHVVYNVDTTSRNLIHRMTKGGDLQNCSESYMDEARNIAEELVVDLRERHDDIEFLLERKTRASAATAKTKKRSIFGGAFNFVGRVDKYLFGVMDDRDAELLYKLAGQSNSTHYKIKQLAVNSLKTTEILESLKPDLVSVSCLAVERKLQHLRDVLGRVTKAYDKITNAVRLSLATQRLSTDILKPQQLLKTLQSVNDSTEHSNWLVPPTMNNVYTILATTTCHAFNNHENKLVFVIRVPRVNPAMYSLYRTLTVPACDAKHVCKFVVPHSRYVGVTDDKKFVRLDSLRSCKTVNDHTLCHDSYETNTLNRDTECDMKLFLNQRLKERDYAKCDVRAARFKPVLFHNVNGLNKWLYMSYKPVTLQVYCRATHTSITIEGTGMLTFRDNCLAETQHTQLVSRYSHDEDAEQTHQILQLDLSRYRIPLNSPLNNINMSQVLHSLNELTPMRQDLARLRQQIDGDGAALLIPNDDNSWADWYEHLGDWWVDLKIFLYIMVVCLVLLALFYIKRCCLTPRDVLLPVFKSAYQR
ncbi:efp [Spodoptera frugiperda granulovirus]|uniref:Efp n=1 Tax=Spodoptera frugiperda granulovirus TaxID=307454 RepID=A0A0C5AS15_9BBAC|nr:efp [Spodoptera frugiperda granulovirus]AJK91684.1 efp [Spodoptera frugiperda granulovirus]